MIALLALAALAGAAPEPALLSKSTRLLDVGKWKEFQLSVGEYIWISNSTILALTSNDSRALINVSTKKATPLQGGVLRGLPFLASSPDRTKFVDWHFKGREFKWRVTDVTGTQNFGDWATTSHQDQPGMDVLDFSYVRPATFWTSDNRIYQTEGWSDNQGAHIQVVERDPAGPETANNLALANFKELFAPIGIYDGKVLAAEQYGASSTTYPLQEWDLAAPAKTLRQWTIRGPRGMMILEYIPSPDYRRAIWMMGKPGRHAFDEEGYPYRAISLWVSGLHGENMSEVGEIDFETEDVNVQMREHQYFGGLQWNPDGRRASFIYRRKLYLVSL